jgi:Predicted kinase related to galactokinase and mevalonate kinase
MRYRLSLPARINLLGNPGDANEGDFATLSAAVDLHAGAIVEPADGLVLETIRRDEVEPPSLRLEFRVGEWPLPYDGQLDLVKSAYNGLYRYSAEFRGKVTQRGVRLAVWSDVPRQSGLGGSSLFVLLALAALREFYDLDRRAHNEYVLAELAQRFEAKELGITCGFADRYVPLFGGVVYVDYRGKLRHADPGDEPFATVERLDAWADDPPLVIASSGVERDSGDVHGRMRPRYLQEHAAWQANGGEMPPMVRFMTEAWQTAWRGKIALLRGDWSTFGALMNENHQLVNEMMAYCEFTDGAGWANNLLIRSAQDFGALGAKLTGAGGGGSVFALVRPGDEGRIMEALARTAVEVSLTSARIYRPHLSRQGLVVEAM